MACFVHISREFARQSSRTAHRSFSQSALHAKQKYPLYPSVAQLLREKRVPSSDVDKIHASGPKGRILKGDVLAYLGSISSSYASEQSARISKLSHLDLSNIKLAAPPNKDESPALPTRKPLAPSPPAIEEPETEVAVSISFKAVLEVQKRIQDTLEITLPLSEFLARAADVANDDLPRPENLKPTADELFNQVLGLDKVDSQVSRGSFTPQVQALPAPHLPSSSSSPVGPVRKLDIIDILAGTTAPSKGRDQASGIFARSDAAGVNTLLSVTAPRGEERRARVFLERVKTILQVEPERLVL